MLAPADAGGIHETPGLAAELDEFIDRVAGGAGSVVHHHSLGAGKLVQEGGLADVGASDQGDPARAAGAFDALNGGKLRQGVHDVVQQVGDAAAVQRGDGVRLAEAQAPQDCGVGFLDKVVHLVGHKDDRLLAPPEHFHHGLVGGGCAHCRVDDEQHCVSQLHCHFGLLRHPGMDAAGIVFPAAGVH